MDFGRSRAKLMSEGPKTTFKDVAGLDEEKAEVIRFMEDIQKYREIQNYALSLIGFEPILREKMNSNDEDM